MKLGGREDLPSAFGIGEYVLCERKAPRFMRGAFYFSPFRLPPFISDILMAEF